MSLEQLALAFEIVGIYGSILLAPIVPALLWLKGDKKLFHLYILGFIIISAAVYGLKFLIQAPRPGPVAQSPPLFYNTSFPSGHSARAFLYSIFLSQRFERFFQFTLYLLAFLTAIGKIITQEHFPIDVIAGSLIGIAVSWLTIKYQDRILRSIKIS